MLLTIVLVNLALGIFASPAPQAKGGGCTPGGLQKGSETPVKDVFDDGKSGSGPYPAHFVQDGPSSGFTLYAPKTPPPSDVKLPVLVYATCGRQGSEYKNILNEVASRGYIVVAAGPPRGKGGGGGSATPAAKSPYGTSDAGNMKFAIDWIKAGNGKKYGNIDADNIATGGLSCGGLSVILPTSLMSLANYIQSMDASRGNDKVKLTLVVHSGLLDTSKTPQLKELKAPIAYIIGGPKDLAYCNVSSLNYLSLY
jgi:hypothetical protein